MFGNCEPAEENCGLPIKDDTAELRARVKALENALDRDKTGLAAALAAIREEVKGRRWICEGRGPYTYDDDRYRQETGNALDAIEKIAAEALAASGKLADELLIEGPSCDVLDSTGMLRCEKPKGHDGKHYGDNGLSRWDWT